MLFKNLVYLGFVERCLEHEVGTRIMYQGRSALQCPPSGIGDDGHHQIQQPNCQGEIGGQR